MIKMFQEFLSEIQSKVKDWEEGSKNKDTVIFTLLIYQIVSLTLGILGGLTKNSWLFFLSSLMFFVTPLLRLTWKYSGSMNSWEKALTKRVKVTAVIWLVFLFLWIVFSIRIFLTI